MIKNQMKIISLVLVVVLIVSSFFIYFEYYADKEILQEQTEYLVTLDDHISRLENQGVVLAILLIRHQGFF